MPAGTARSNQKEALTRKQRDVRFITVTSMPTIHAIDDDGRISMSVVRHETVEQELQRLTQKGYTIKEIED